MKMKYTKAQRRHDLIERLRSLGFTYDECQKLRRIEMTLHRWAEHECNGNIQREGDDGEGKPRWHSSDSSKGYRIADRERGALKRLESIIAARNLREYGAGRMAQFPLPDNIVYYHQGDPRGCALYVGLKSDIGDRSIDSCYSRLVAVCD